MSAPHEDSSQEENGSQMFPLEPQTDSNLEDNSAFQSSHTLQGFESSQKFDDETVPHQPSPIHEHADSDVEYDTPQQPQSLHIHTEFQSPSFQNRNSTKLENEQTVNFSDYMNSEKTVVEEDETEVPIVEDEQISYATNDELTVSMQEELNLQGSTDQDNSITMANVSNAQLSISISPDNDRMAPMQAEQSLNASRPNYSYVTQEPTSDSLMSRIQGLLQISKTDQESICDSISKLDESLSMLDTEKRIEELKNLAAVVDKQFTDLLIATDPSKQNSPQSASQKTPSSNRRSSQSGAENPSAQKSSEKAPDDATLPMCENISNMSVTFSEREREIDDILDKIKSRNRTVNAVAPPSTLTQTLPPSQPKPEIVTPRLPPLNRSVARSVSSAGESEDSLGKRVSKILNGPFEKLELDELAAGAQILNGILHSARSGHTDASRGCPSESDASVASTNELQRQINRFENSEMWRYVQSFLPGATGKAAALANVRSSSDAPSMSSKRPFMTSTASPTPQKLDLGSSPTNTKSSMVSTARSLPFIQPRPIRLARVDDITASTIQNETTIDDSLRIDLAHGDTAPLPKRDLFKITTSESEQDPPPIRLKRQSPPLTQTGLSSTGLSSFTSNPSDASFRIPSLTEFRQMSSAQQREIMARLRKIRHRRSRKGDYKRIPSPVNVPTNSTSISQNNVVSSETMEGSSLLPRNETGDWYHRTLESSKNMSKSSEVPVAKPRKTSVPPEPTKKTVIHEISEQNMDTSASEVITIVHRSKRTHLEKSVKQLKTRGLQTSFIIPEAEKENTPPVSASASHNTSSETLVIARDPTPVPEKAKVVIVEPPKPVAKPVVWFDDLAGGMMEYEASRLDARPITETVTLQERFLLYNRHFISKSRERLRKLDFMQQERNIQKVWAQQRENLQLGNYEINRGRDMARGRSPQRGGRSASRGRELSPVLQKRREVAKMYGRTRSPSPPRKTNPKVEAKLQILHRAEKRPINPKKMIRKSRDSWKKLPENKEKLLQNQRQAQYATYRLNAKCFNRRIQQEALGHREKCT